MPRCKLRLGLVQLGSAVEERWWTTKLLNEVPQGVGYWCCQLLHFLFPVSAEHPIFDVIGFEYLVSFGLMLRNFQSKNVCKFQVERLWSTRKKKPYWWLTQTSIFESTKCAFVKGYPHPPHCHSQSQARPIHHFLLETSNWRSDTGRRIRAEKDMARQQEQEIYEIYKITWNNMK